MKNSIIILMAGAFLVGCASDEEKRAIAAKEIMDARIDGALNAPDWVKAPTLDDEFIYAVGESTLSNTSLARTQAEARAFVRVANQISQTVKSFVDQTASAQETNLGDTVLQQLETASSNLADATIVGAQVTKYDVRRNDVGITTYVEVRYSRDAAKNQVKEEIDSLDPTIDEKHQELMGKLMDRF